MRLCPACFDSAPRGAHCGAAACAAALSGDRSADLLPIGTLLHEHIRVGRPLGRGGFGITYLVFDEEAGARLAMKEYFPLHVAGRSAADRRTVVPAGDDEEARAELTFGLRRFRDEMMQLAWFAAEPGIVQVRGWFEANATAYLLLEYLPGNSMRKVLQQRGRLPWPEAIRVFAPVLSALEAVHRKALIHRDVKPGNIMLADDGRVTLLDFGAARVMLGQRSQRFSVVVSDGYAPPEQYLAAGQGPWTDVYAIAATLYHALVGQPLLPAPARGVPIAAPRTQGVSMPAGAEQALLDALSLDARKRPQSIAALRQRLGMPVAQPQVPVAPQPRTLARIANAGRGPGLAAAALACLGLFGCFGYGTVQHRLRTLRVERDAAVTARHALQARLADAETRQQSTMRQYDTARRVIADRFPNVTSVQTVHRPALLGTDLAVTRVIPAHLLESLVVIARGPNHCAYLDGECTVTFTTRVLREPQSYFDPAPGTPIEEVVRHEETVSIGSWDGDWVYRHVLGSIPPQPGDYIIEVTASRAGVSSGLIHRIRASPY